MTYLCGSESVCVCVCVCVCEPVTTGDYPIKSRFVLSMVRSECSMACLALGKAERPPPPPSCVYFFSLISFRVFFLIRCVVVVVVVVSAPFHYTHGADDAADDRKPNENQNQASSISFYGYSRKWRLSLFFFFGSDQVLLGITGFLPSFFYLFSLFFFQIRRWMFIIKIVKVGVKNTEKKTTSTRKRWRGGGWWRPSV